MTRETEFPLAFLLLDVGASYAGTTPPPASVQQFLQQFDQLQWYSHGYRIEEVQEGWRVSVNLPPLPDGELVLQLPGFDLFSLVLQSQRFNDHPVLEIVDPVGDDGYLELKNLRIALRLNHDLLRPVGDTQQVELSYTGSLLMDRQWQFQLTGDPSLELTPCEIGNSGIRIAFSGVQFDLRSDRAIPPLKALGYADDFIGIYAADGYLEVLPQSLFGETPGLRVTCRECVIGNQGFSGEIRQYYELKISNGQIDPGSGMVGQLFNAELQLALEATEIVLHNNHVTDFKISGWLRLPVLQTVVAAQFGLQQLPGGSYGYRLHLEQKTERAFQLDPLTLVVTDLELDGNLQAQSFSLFGQLSATLALPGFDIFLQQAALQVAHSPQQDLLRIDVENLQIGPLGQVDLAHLLISSRDAGNDSSELSVQIETRLQWRDLHSRLGLDQLPDFIPLPPNDAEIAMLLTWESGKLVVRFSAQVTEPDALWGFIPVRYRPEVRNAALVFKAEYADAAAFNNASHDDAFSTAFSLALSLRLPELREGPLGELMQWDTGDEAGWIDAELSASLVSDDSGDPRWQIAMAVQNPVSLDWQIPGMTQTPAPLHTALTSLGFNLDMASGAEGEITLEGDFHIRPIDPPDYLPFAPHLQQLLEPVQSSELAGSVKLKLTFKDDKAAMSLDCQFSDAELSFDIFDVINNLAGGLSSSAAESEAIPLDLDVGFNFKGIRVELGSLQDDDASHFLFQFALEFSLPGIDPVACHFRLSDEAMALGISRAAIPLEVPAFPLTTDDLNQITPSTPANSAWDSTLWNSKLTSLQDRINQLKTNNRAERNRRELRQLGGKLFLLKNLKGIHGLMSSSTNERLLQTYTETLIGAFDGISAVTHFESDIELVLEDIELNIPFDNPQALGLAGTAFLDGFTDDDPFKAIEGIHMTLGIAADQFYFELENPGNPIPLPDFGRYPGGSINLSRLRIGYAYTRNALSVAFAGALTLPAQLVEDADTSDLIGAGVRLPTHNALSFRLDLIPVTLGAVDFVVPLFEFDLDLRKPNSQALVSTQSCQPYWDGLQLIVPGLYHDSFKHLAFSPLFSMSVIPNFRFDGDLMLGDETNGLTVVADEVLVLLGYYTGGTPVPIPFFASPTEPYFDNLCVNLRFAGFGINFNLQRPFPSLSPLALFEVLGLLADPMMPIDPNGSLANTVRVALTDGAITLPRTVRKLFPELVERLDKPLNISINLGSFIAATQQLGRSLSEVAETLQQSGQSVQQRITRLRAHPPELALPRLLEMLPPELRKLRVSGAFANFDATAVLIILDTNDKGHLKQLMQQRGQVQPLQTDPSLQLGQDVDPDQVHRYRPNLPAGSGFSRELRPDDANNNVLLGIEFQSFQAADIDALPAPAPPMNGILVGAHIKLFAGQRYRFMGCLYEDGSFGLISALDIKPLKLAVAGIPVALPLHIDGRLAIQGRAKRDGVVGHLSAQVFADWKALPGVVRVTVGSAASPLQLKLYSDGRYRLQGPGSVQLFRGAAQLNGAVDISERHCLVQGDLRYKVANIIELALTCSGRVGPGQQFLLSGSGDLKILGQPLTSVTGQVSESAARLSARMAFNRLPVNGQWLDCRLQGGVNGSINLKKRTRPEFELTGKGRWSLLGAAIEGQATIRQKGSDTQLAIQGDLDWQGQRWLGGRIRIGNQGIALGGRLALGLALSPSNIASTDLAHLFLSIDLDGEFILDATAALGHFDIKGQCTLAARLPGSDQALPLAMQRMRGRGTTQLALTLVQVSGFTMLPFEGINIPVPTISGSTTPSPIRFGEITHNIAGVQVKNPAASWAGYKLELAGGVMPVVTSGALSNTQTKRKVPVSYRIALDTENPIAINLPFDAAFELAIVWRTSSRGLAIRVRRSGRPDQFYSLDNLL